MSRFIAPMLWRETRGSWRRLLLFLLCITAGVGGLVSVNAFSENLTSTVRIEARTLMAADMVMRSSRPPGTEELAVLDELREQGAEAVSSLQFVTMVRAGEQRAVQIVAVRAVGEGYPFYGKVTTASGRPFRELVGDDRVLVAEALLLKTGLAIGDRLEIGERSFRIADVLVTEPDSPVQVFQLGPRVMMTERAARATGLVTPLSRVRYSTLVRLAPGADALAVANEIAQRLQDEYVRVDTVERAQPQVTRFLSRLTDFLSLVGLAALLLGGIGVAGAIRVFIAQKLDTLATLKCLGATSSRLLAVYLLLALLMGTVGSLLGVGIGVASQWALPALLGDLIPVKLAWSVPWWVVAEGMAFGILTTLWFSLPPLLSLRSIPPALVFRRDVQPLAPNGRRWLAPLKVAGSMLLLCALLVVWQAGFTQLAGWFMLGLVGTVSVLYLAAVGMLAGLKRLPKPSSFTLKQGLSGLYRPGNQSSAITVSLGLGVLLLLAVFLIQDDLVRQITVNAPKNQPNLFFIDIQPHQVDTLTEVLSDAGVKAPDAIPIVRGRIVGLRGAPLKLSQVGDDHQRRHLRFEYTLTYRGYLEDGEQIVAGRFEKDPAIPGAQISVSNRFARESGVQVGDPITFDIQGVEVRATVTSIRVIEWTNRRANFSFVFLPGALEDAPRMFASGVRVNDAKERAALQRTVVTRMPNVTALDVEMVYTIVQGFMDRLSLVIRFMAGFCIAVGVVILLGAVATTKYQRIREAVLLKTLGATRWMVARVLAMEYLLLGLLAGAVGAVAAGVFSWALVTQVFAGQWDIQPLSYLIAWLATASLITGTGLLTSLDILVKKPLEVLREE